MTSPRSKTTTTTTNSALPTAWPKALLLAVLVATSNYASLYLGMRLSSDCHQSYASTSSKQQLPSIVSTTTDFVNNNIGARPTAVLQHHEDTREYLSTNLRRPRHQQQQQQQHFEEQKQTSSLSSSTSWSNIPILSPNNNKKVVLVTGGAGFIGSHVTAALLQRGDTVIILDNMNDYYNVSVKEANLEWVKEIAAAAAKQNYRNHAMNGESNKYTNLFIYRGDINNSTLLTTIFEHQLQQKQHPHNDNHSNSPITHICHLAARAGVRPSIQHPHLYIETNIMGTLNILEFAHEYNVTNVVMASSSSVYGEEIEDSSTTTTNNNNNNSSSSRERALKSSFAEDLHSANTPLSPYAQTKRSVELLSYTYHTLYQLNITNLRFFTVYGPRGRPDMAPHIFISNIFREISIEQYGDGKSSRDYTYIEDVVNGVLLSLDRSYPYQIINVGGGSEGTTLTDFIALVEKHVGKQAKIVQKPNQLGDVSHTRANITKAKRLLGYAPSVTMDEGVRRTVQWYKETYVDK